MQQWNEVFREAGTVFTEVQEDIPRVAGLFKKHKVKNVLDLGCGSGRHTVYLAKRGFAVWGLDIAPEGLKLTRAWLRKEQRSAKLKLGSIYDRLPYRSDFFDAVISTQTLHHATIEDIRGTIAEMERILRPGGLVFLTLRRGVLQKHGDVDYIAPRTYVPHEGIEKGLPHYMFNKSLIKKEFARFEIPEMWFDSGRRHYCFVGHLKSRGEP